MKMNKELRLQVRSDLATWIWEEGFAGDIALCKETLEVWRALADEGILEDPRAYPEWAKAKCNCVP